MNRSCATAGRLVVLQSNYVPWRGYFDLIHDADLFIFYDDLQYTKNDWRNRNRIKTDKGSEWLTIPAGTDLRRLICEVKLPDPAWQTNHWRLLVRHYSRAPHFGTYSAFFEDFYLGHTWPNLSELNQYLIKAIARDMLGMRTEFADSRDFRLQGKKLDRLLELVTKSKASVYISGPAAKDYIDKTRFEAEGVKLEWKDYSGYPDYPQNNPPFRGDVSILDLLFNVGPDASWYIWGWRSRPEGPAA